MPVIRSPIRSPISSAIRSPIVGGRKGDPYGRTFLADAATGLLLPGFTYTRSGPDLWCPQADGSLASFAANVIPREWANGRWGFRFDPGWVQSVLNSHDLTAGTWTPSGVTVQRVSAGCPDGSTTTNRVVPSTASAAFKETQYSVSHTTGQTYTATCVFKADGYRYVQFVGGGTVIGSVLWNVDAQTATETAYTAGTSSVQGRGVIPLVDGWCLAWMTYTALASGSTGVRLNVIPAAYSGRGVVWAADGVSGVLLHCHNLTSTSYPVPLTAAQGATVTVPDFSCNAQLSALGIALGTAFSVIADFAPSNLTALFGHVWNVGRTSTSYVALNHLDASAKTGARSLVNGSSSVVGVDYASSTERQRVAMRISGSGCKLGVNGGLSAEDITVSIDPALDRFSIGRNSYGSNVVAMSLTSLAIVPNRALSDAELQTLSAFTPEDFGAVYILRNRDRYVRPGLAFSRAAEVYEPQADGSMVAYSGSQVPWGVNGVRLDPGWTQSLKDTNDFTTASWIKTGVQVVDGDTTPGPFGVPVQAWAGSAGSSLKRLRQNLATTTLGPWHARWLIKPGTEDSADFVVQDSTASNGARVTVNLLTGALTSGPAAVGTATVIAATATVLPNGFVDVSIGVNFATALTQLQAIATWDLNGASATNGTLYPACANLTNTAYPVPFTVAQGSAVTVPNFSFAALLADMGVTLGAEYAIGMEYEVIYRVPNQYPPVAQLRVGAAGGSSISTGFFVHPNGTQFALVRNTADIYIQQSGATGQARSVLRVKDGAFRAASNGVLATAGNSGVQPSGLTAVQIGRDGGGGAGSMFIKSVWLIPTSGLSDAQLQALSTL